MRYHAPPFRVTNGHAPRAQVRGEVFRQHSEQMRDRLHGLTLIDMTGLPLPPDYLLDGTTPTIAFLDIGSGLGRVTRYLLPKLPDGTYDGIDTVPT